jgi:hypothetical protein
MLLSNLAAHHAAELDVAAAAAAAAAAPGTGSGGGNSSRDQRAGRRRNSNTANLEATGTSRGGDCSDDERVRRRREINRNSQKRIRERRNKEMDGLKTEVGVMILWRVGGWVTRSLSGIHFVEGEGWGVAAPAQAAVDTWWQKGQLQ